MTKAAMRALSAVVNAFVAAGALIVRKFPAGKRTLGLKPKLRVA